MPRLSAVYFQPPIAFARLGGSDQPLENYEWRDDPSVHGGARTVIEPATTIDVAGDGSATCYRPGVLRFRDGALLRPVAPFFELWVQVEYGPDDAESADRANAEVPLTTELLARLGGSLAGITYSVHVANRKAARRTGDEDNAFEAFASAHADQHSRVTLLGATQPRPNSQPLVRPEAPIPLGSFQVLRPIRRKQLDIDLDVLRVRFTPARGEVYGPPAAEFARGWSNPTGKLFEIVPAQNRCLNPEASWLRYDGSYVNFFNPEPSDTYDGSDQDANVSWGVVDDTCDGTLTASVVVLGQRFSASARICVSPPDYAPDRRPFVSLADDLADRDLEPGKFDAAASNTGIKRSVTDLLERVHETAGLLNLDMIRARGIGDNRWITTAPPKVGELPLTDAGSMTTRDVGYADERIQIAEASDVSALRQRLTPVIDAAHTPLATHDELWTFLRAQPDRARKILRPAYGAIEELKADVKDSDIPSPEHRDPRISRDQAHDMRMPPYMRDELGTALSLTRRQYRELRSAIDALQQPATSPVAATRALRSEPEAESVSESTESEVRSRVRAVLARARSQAAPRRSR